MPRPRRCAAPRSDQRSIMRCGLDSDWASFRFAAVRAGQPPRCARNRLMLVSCLSARSRRVDAFLHDIADLAPLIAFRTPANGARRVCSIFITSSQDRGSLRHRRAPFGQHSSHCTPGSVATILSRRPANVAPPNGSPSAVAPALRVRNTVHGLRHAAMRVCMPRA